MDCTYTNMCKTALGLYCSTTGNLCECPVSLNAGFCDCPDTKYYNYTTVKCGNYFIYYLLLYIILYCSLFPCKENRNTYNQVCDFTYMCLQYINLTCSSGFCICNSRHYWTGSSCGIYVFQIFVFI